ncbi:uncharacterized protein LOC110254305 isoform X1 [Exaiptasia diaphana]|uniref:Uncharacterized protein n=1 Tax=Exaiptasia diaphana TaxID=2652724 RepID=A0A913YYS7_EXADI|nr:uncharacterized protein LOC110254305 isoform X1 [Exaiptasia diaphana]
MSFFCCWRNLFFREQFALRDSFYEEVTDEKWKILTTSSTRQHSKKNDNLVIPQDMLLMKTNVLSHIPECFDLSSPKVPVKHRGKLKERHPPKTQVFVQKRPKNEPLVRTKSDEEKIKHFQERNRNLRHETASDSNSTTKVRFTDADGQVGDPSSYTYQKTKSKIRLKTKTKIRRSNWRSKSAPTLRRNEEITTSCTEFSQETNISFAAYVKKRTPNLNLSKKSKAKTQKLRRTHGSENINLVGFAGKDESLKSASKRNVTFNPIFEDEDFEEQGTAHNTRENHVTSNRLSRESHVSSRINENTKSRGSDLKSAPKRHTDHVQNFESLKRDPHVQGTNRDIEVRSHNDDTEYEIPITRIDDNLTEFDEEKYSDHVPVTCIDQRDPHVPVTCIGRENYSNDVPVTCIDDVPVTCIDEILEHHDHVQNKNDYVGSHVRKPTLIRAGRLHDLDMCNWYDEDYDYDYNQEYDDDDDDFETRMLRRTATILTFDLKSRRRELYTIDEQPNEE